MEYYMEYFQMSEPLFKMLLKLVTPILGTGITQTAAAHSFAISQTTISKIFKETTKAIYDALKDVYIGEPSKERWKKNAEKFEVMWNVPNFIGAIDGKHVQIKKPRNSGSKWINYKGTHSVVLMAVAGANYTFEYVDVGFGRQSDGGTWQNCTLSRALYDGE
ncbi:hypothetical protein RvY_01787 [Ramazzottius varieornatus]|uniref:DDE Tnp4 domain-containing protein n=1 Tax=Ramazzottius varieornatus TaxID=947166 RepID=A0A1D1UL02_RAMVA|nr:hypothetical protein RvY_01787 [Ramazzottius varieornatus]